jgi:hypothetical protein
MLPSAQIFSIYPSVIPAGRTTRMTIVANERAFMFREEQNYTVKVIAVNSDENYYAPRHHQIYEVTPHDGVLTFEHNFEGEQEHTVLLILDEKVQMTFTVYSLCEDLFPLKPLKGDLHSHSCRSDATRDPSALFAHYRAHGFDFAALTDHNRYYPGGEYDESFSGIHAGIVRVTGEEVHCPDSVLHVVHVGGRESIADRYIHHREQYESDIEYYLTKVPSEIPEKYRGRYARALWLTDAVHQVGGLAIFAHPYWRPGSSKSFNVCDELARILLLSGMFDAYELIGGMGQTGNNRSVALWSELRAEGLRIPVVGSSDQHVLEGITFDRCFTLCFAEQNTNDDIISAVKNGMTVAVEASGDGYAREYRCYGSLRLVSYAHFLLNHYFPTLQRLGEGLSVAMRTYDMEDVSPALIEEQAALLEKFSARFFGKMPPPLPTEAMLAFEEKWRNVQLTQGPLTRGSSVDANPAKSLI